MKALDNTFLGKTVGFFGLGKSNLALIDSLPLDGAEIILRSDGKIRREELPKRLRGCKIFEGDAALRDISEDVLFLSPSVRRDRREISEAAIRGVKISSDYELFLEKCEKPIYAVTGSDGKSTTATLIALLLGEKCSLIGNVGVPMYPALFGGADNFVCEISSFMLSASVPRAKRACVTNITPNHLDFHGSFEEYARVKLSLLDYADEKIINFDDEILRDYAKSTFVFGITSARQDFSTLKSLCRAKIYVTYEKNAVFLNGVRLIGAEGILRREPHNIKNLMTAIAVTCGEVSREKIREVAESFSGLAHRCELVGRFNGVDYFNSSIDSTPARTAETICSLGRRAVIILGGRGKGVSYDALCDPLKFFCARAVIYGEDAEVIHRAIKDACPTLTVDGFDEAVVFAKELGRECGAVLLSPAATSYDEFKNFEKRGERFKKIIQNL